jgi:hypothetical protein
MPHLPVDGGGASLALRANRTARRSRVVARQRKLVRFRLGSEADFSYWRCYQGEDGPIAQLDRVTDFYSVGCRFESCWDRQLFQLDRLHTPGSLSPTVKDAAAFWIKRCREKGLEATTVSQYEQHCDLYIAPLIGAKKLSDLTVPACNAFADQLRDEGPHRGHDKKDYSLPRLDLQRGAAASGYNPKQIQKLMGHSSIKVTFDVDGHLFADNEADQRAAEDVESDCSEARSRKRNPTFAYPNARSNLVTRSTATLRKKPGISPWTVAE